MKLPMPNLGYNKCLGLMSRNEDHGAKEKLVMPKICMWSEINLLETYCGRAFIDVVLILLEETAGGGTYKM